GGQDSLLCAASRQSPLECRGAPAALRRADPHARVGAA
ncbi:hypothetical protein ETH_00036955, partial [Eimeria tenella]